MTDIDSEHLETTALPVDCMNKVLLQIALLALVFGYLLLPVSCSIWLDSTSMWYNAAAASGPLLSVIIVLVWIRKYCGSWRGVAALLKLEKFPVRWLALGLPAALLLQLIGGALSWLWNYLLECCGVQCAKPAMVELALTGNLWQLLMIGVTALLAAPVFEEILFRRALYSVLEEYSSSTVALLGTALAFSVLHLSLLQLPGLFFLAVVWQKIYLRSNSLYSSVILHFYNNLLAVLLLLAARALGLE